ncbi:putative Mn2+ efflux pump MntP [Branchiibius hedensis]|uniref:Putative manganese efflux pump MntP n=1 Tax=Branchiibius hedensis TaxID=672460 RepID=A0A2Y8ZSC2_9MICO|nr:manganese efflux pump MntP family protein [Branchiibius hedensis]PWJ25973.1 putative Mn2+ efflux pump MntP [Branchiibius hedensis]SSA34785.1 Putative Mn2+ efflux pump MntP [Branchiibius hedensis]
MSLLEILLIAVGVSADAFAVSLSQGVTMRRFRWRHALLIAGLFGLFQALMPLLGWLLGKGFADAISGVDHWIAFGLLALIGGKMLWEAFQDDEEEDDEPSLDLRGLLILAVATSIDALAVGVSFAVLPVNLPLALTVIGVVTFVISLIGVRLGRSVGSWLGKPAEILGGLILIGIGLRIVLSHTGVI